MCCVCVCVFVYVCVSACVRVCVCVSVCVCEYECSNQMSSPHPLPLVALFYFVAVLMFAATELNGLVLLPDPPGKHYSFALGLLTVVLACVSGGVALQALKWQHENLRITGFQINR